MKLTRNTSYVLIMSIDKSNTRVVGDKTVHDVEEQTRLTNPRSVEAIRKVLETFQSDAG